MKLFTTVLQFQSFGSNPRAKSKFSPYTKKRLNYVLSRSEEGNVEEDLKTSFEAIKNVITEESEPSQVEREGKIFDIRLGEPLKHDFDDKETNFPAIGPS